MTRPLIVLAAGGTGGHMFPAAALADALSRRGMAIALVTDRRGQAFALPGGDLTVHRVRAAAVAGASFVAKVKAGVQLTIGTAQAWLLLRRLKPAVVVGFGGYASVPTVVAAHRLGLPIALHEQNAVLGRANRLVAPMARRIATGFPEVEGVGNADRAKLAVTGNPVRPDIVALAGKPYPSLGAEGTLNLLVTGGSQGASLFSRIVPDAVAYLPEGMRRRLRIVQQVRAEDFEAVRARYATLGLLAELSPFFADLPERLSSAHLVIGRAGASTIAETAIAGRPAILVPLATAADDHQTKNARALENAGGAIVMPESAFTAEALAARLQPLLALPEKLRTMAAAGRNVGVADAAERLADLVLATAPANGNESAAAGRSVA
ncbi:MAG: undecaprenyldiphospho-muramoylpentapeptide beta-N-acetylglucosaminyltransferase [Alphaproteobacteria bacterium]|nr:undecaprenyldiphospho-muramoylpentapeptide beta-N-acetylglucosaminyltransferase [Alphaproteobacteria bacterium]